MTSTTPPADTGWSAQPPIAPPPAPARPGTVTGAGIVLIVLGVLTGLIGLLVLIGGGLFARVIGDAIPAEDAAQFGGLMGFFASAIVLVGVIVMVWAILQLLVGFNVLGGKGWARITGIVIAIIGGVLALAGLGDPDGSGVVVGLALLIANAFVVYALATSAPWFASHSRP